MADIEQELREVIEAQEIVIREGGKIVEQLKRDLAHEKKFRETYETLYNERIASARDQVKDDARIVEARQYAEKLCGFLTVARLAASRDANEPSTDFRTLEGIATAIREALS